MKKILKYGITWLLIFAICSVTCFAEQDKISFDNERKIVYQDSTIIMRQNSDGSIIECEYLQTGVREVTYAEGDTIVDRFYDDSGAMISEKIYARSDFISEEIVLTNESKEIIDTTLLDLNQNYEKITPEIIKTKLLEKGISCEVSAVPNGFVIDPLINQTKADATVTLSLNELLSSFPAYNKTAMLERSFISALNGTSKKMIGRYTRNGYAISKRQTFNISAGSSLASAAIAVFMTPASLSNICGLYISIGKFVKNVSINRSMEAYAYSMSQACTYDETNYHREVSVHTINGREDFFVGASSDFAPFGWNSRTGFFKQFSASNIIPKGIEIWNNNMIHYGYWKWGDV